MDRLQKKLDEAVCTMEVSYEAPIFPFPVPSKNRVKNALADLAIRANKCFTLNAV